MNSRQCVNLTFVAVLCCLAGRVVPAQDSPKRPIGDMVKAEATVPEFSWDHVPLYMHVRKAASFTDAEIAFIARFPLITFEKATGFRDHGSIEAGTLVAARAVKRINPRATILYYRNVIVHYGNYAANDELQQIDGAFLRDGRGNTKLVRGRVEAYDLSNPAVRDWWVEACQRVVADAAIDGVFFDGNIKALEPGYLVREIGREKKCQVTEGYHLMVRQTRSAIGADKLMVANMLRARFPAAGQEYLQPFAGSYIENFFHNVGGVSYEEYVAKGIEAVQAAARAGKIIAFTSGLAAPADGSEMGIDEGHAKVLSDEQARTALVYPLAVFLICAEKQSYFRVHEGYSADEDDRWMRWFPEYDRPLGPPQGPAKRNGYRYTREFEHASVRVDIQRRFAEIDWR